MRPQIILEEPCGAHKAFIKRVRREHIVDTRRYRYICSDVKFRGKIWEVIARLPIAYVGTEKMLDEENWALVEKILLWV